MGRLYNSYNGPNGPGNPDTVLLMVKDIVKKEPKLKYAPLIAYNTFAALLKTDFQKAYTYGKEVLATSCYDDTAYRSIIDPISVFTENSNLPREIYALGADALQRETNQFPYPERISIHKRCNLIADWYWRSGDSVKAVNAQKRAIEALANENNFSADQMAEYKLRLQKYSKSPVEGEHANRQLLN